MSASTQTVPDDLRGVWMRTLRQADTDAAAPPHSDNTSWVRWLQTSAWHAALCLPASAMAGRSAQPLQALSTPQLAALADQEGFAGITRMEAQPEGLICQRLRRIDYQPPGLHPDAGWLVSQQAHQMVEICLHADRNETWERLPDSTGRFVALGCTASEGPPDGLRLLLAGQYMVLVRARKQAWPRGMAAGFTLADVMLSCPEQAHQWLDGEISFGRWQQGAWHIEHSTLPEREGQAWPCTLQKLDDARALVHLPGLPAQWQILEWSSAPDCLAP